MPKLRPARSLFLLLALLCVPGLVGQGISDTFFTLGTSVEDLDTDGETWNYLIWQAEDLELLRGEVFAVYRKIGPKSSVQPYQLVGLAQPRTDVLSLGALIHRAASLGEDPVALEEHLDGLFENLMPLAGLTLLEKLSAVLEGATADAEIYEKMVFLSRRHPAIALAMGTALADPVSDGLVYTYEVRQCPPVVGDPDAECVQVVGRVTLEAGQVLPLPAPGVPIEVPFVDNAGNRDPRNNLVARLRWSTPDDLRRRSLLQFGYNLYRMTEEDAVADGFHLAPPGGDVLRALADAPGHSTTLVNEAPILVDPLLTDAQAANIIADPETYYYIDDNDRYAPGGEPFKNGEVYYYFVTSLDLLLRDGESSPGTAVLICDALPPPPPMQVRVTNEYTYDEATTTNYQHFKVAWAASDVSERINPEAVIAYRVYRWWSIEEMQAMASQPNVDATNTTGGLVGIVGAGDTEFIDNAPNAPFLRTIRNSDGTVDVEQSYAGKTFWYTVRSVDQSACGGNLSGNSAPAYGVLRDRRGPPKATGTVLIDCFELAIRLRNEGETIAAWESPAQTDKVYLEFNVSRDDPRIDYVELYLDRGTADEVYLGRHAYPPTGMDAAMVRLILPEAVYVAGSVIDARVLSENDTASPWLSFDYSQTIPATRALLFKLGGELTELTVDADSGCGTHPPTNLDGSINGVQIEIQLTTGTEEYKLYRRVDDGPLTLIEQGLASASSVLSVLVEDLNLPVNGARICYFVQLFDEHGNPSPMVRITCIETEARVELPTPMLAAPESVGDLAGPEADLSWFCPPYGVERFRLWVRANDTEALPMELGPQLRPKGAPIVFPDGVYHPFETVRVSSSFGSGPEFTVRLEGIEAGREYIFFVQALGRGTSTSAPSNVQTYRWLPNADETVTGPNVPWPARPLPNLNTAFAEGVEALIFPDGDFDGGLVRIGRMVYEDPEQPKPNKDGTSDFAFPYGLTNPTDAVFRNARDESLLPLVLYRFQVPNSNYAIVSGDVYQVSPLIESFATEEIFNAPLAAFYELNHDAFIAAAPADPVLGPDVIDLFVKDTSPVISGAAYRYLIVRYDPVSREIVEVIPTNSISIP
jgi:hypothetical protein